MQPFSKKIQNESLGNHYQNQIDIVPVSRNNNTKARTNYNSLKVVNFDHNKAFADAIMTIEANVSNPLSESEMWLIIFNFNIKNN